jgi:hypothetical protein
VCTETTHVGGEELALVDMRDYAAGLYLATGTILVKVNGG